MLAAVQVYCLVLQICHCVGQLNRITIFLPLADLTLPDKIRHGEVAQIEITISMIFCNGLSDLFHDGLEDTWRYDNTPLGVE